MYIKDKLGVAEKGAELLFPNRSSGRVGKERMVSVKFRDTTPTDKNSRELTTPQGW